MNGVHSCPISPAGDAQPVRPNLCTGVLGLGLVGLGRTAGGGGVAGGLVTGGGGPDPGVVEQVGLLTMS